MKAYKGEVWKVYRVNYKTDKFEEVGTMYFDYDKFYEWLDKQPRITSGVKEWLKRFAKEHGLKGETLVHEVIEYVRR